MVWQQVLSGPAVTIKSAVEEIFEAVVASNSAHEKYFVPPICLCLLSVISFFFLASTFVPWLILSKAYSITIICFRNNQMYVIELIIHNISITQLHRNALRKLNIRPR